MTLPPVVRVFFAIDIPLEAKEMIGQYINHMKKQAKSHSIRWSKPENLHITLQFLAEVKTEHIPDIVAKVREKLTGIFQASTLVLGKPRLFPSPFRPRVIVLEIMPQIELAGLSSLIGEGILACDYAIEDRPFHAHMTLGRIKHTHVHLEFLAEMPAPNVGKLDVKEVVLFRSEPQADGSVYTAIERIGLEE